MTTQELYAAIDRLPRADKWRLVNHVLRSLEQEVPVATSTNAWRNSLKAMYGVFADDPLERPEQLPLEERDQVE